MATYYVDMAGGSDASADPTNPATPWKTIDKAMNTVSAGDKVWVKASADYTETATIDTAGTKSSPITFEGYTSSTGDGGRATINGGASRASGILDSLAANTRAYYVFKNFRITNHTSHGVNTDQNHLVWKNCKFDANGTTSGHGYLGRQAMFENCEFSDNTLDGCNISNTGAGVFVGCRFYRNTVDGLDCGVGLVCAFCEFFSNGAEAITCGQNNDAGGLSAIINCTIDGDSKDSTTGVLTNVSFHPEICIVNTVIYDCTTGVTADHGTSENHISRNNLVNSNTTAYSGFSTPTGEVTSAPGFNNEAANDYRPGTGSALLLAGYDANQLESFSAAMDIGALQTGSAGSCDYPSEDDVRDGVTFASGASTGNLELPVEDDVEFGVSYGTNGSEFTGTVTLPAVTDVESGVQYGADGTEFTGTLVVTSGGGDFGDKRAGKQ